MLKELFEGYFYITYPKIRGEIVNLKEQVFTGNFSLSDDKACQACRFGCGSAGIGREQLKVSSKHTTNIINLDQVFSFVKENLGETCDYMLTNKESVTLVEMSCSTDDNVKEKRPKARRQLYNTLTLLYTCYETRRYVDEKNSKHVVFSWKETFDYNSMTDDIGDMMKGMLVMVNEVYSPDNESRFEFGFKFKEIRYPYTLDL